MSAIDRFAGVRILCVGDVMLDRFVSGAVKRISPESPVPVLLVGGAQAVAGGAGNVARNIAALGGKATLIGVAGADAAGADLTAALSETAGVVPRLVITPTRVTTEKTRFVAQGQHMIRADIESAEPLDAETQARLIDHIRAHVAEHDALVLSDYAKGVLSDAVVAGAIAAARELGLPIVVDPKSAKLGRYSGATVVTPNAKEALEATGIDPAADDARAEAAGRDILQRADIAAALITRAQHGMSCVPRGGEAVHLAASAREVFDVVGAGDTVVATLALALGAGEPLASAAYLANAAAGIVVGKHGTATVSASELADELLRLGEGSLDTLGDKIYAGERLLEKVAQWRREGRAVGFTNGCFDLLHVGHLAILSFARRHSGRLIVGLNSDASVRRLKGATRPINSERDRAMVLAALSAVDAVAVFDEDTPVELIRAIAPDVLVKGADYTIDKIIGADIVLANGGRVLTCDLVPGKSTTQLAQVIKGDAAV